VLLELDGLPFRRKDLTILAQVKEFLLNDEIDFF
jgi:hypothetical protein